MPVVQERAIRAARAHDEGKSELRSPIGVFRGERSHHPSNWPDYCSPECIPGKATAPTRVVKCGATLSALSTAWRLPFRRCVPLAAPASRVGVIQSSTAYLPQAGRACKLCEWRDTLNTWLRSLR